jgi:NDP-sugar pyrophosphorylase family protein
MNDLTLLVMAAGSGSRYGGLKQIEPLGPAGETIVDYSIFDALRYGFHKVVFVIRRDIEDAFREVVGARIEKQAEVHYVFQEEAAPAGPEVAGPASPEVNTKRSKPWGTAHAVLCAARVIDEPFAVINADDHYGRDSFRVLTEHFRSNREDAALVGFRLRNTLSEFGPVKRGLCVISDGKLQSVTEFGELQADDEGISYVDPDGLHGHLTGDEIVSMNFWGFQPTIFPILRRKWLEFARENGDSESAEFYIPSLVTDLIAEGEGSCRVLRTSSRWFGVTYREDRPNAILLLRDLISRGEYPEPLWS